jgi:hypothetical protein
MRSMDNMHMETRFRSDINVIMLLKNKEREMK